MPGMTGWPISFDQPQWLWLLTTIPLVVAGSIRWLTALERPRRIAAIVLRVLVVIALAAALARVECVKRSDRVAVMFVMDRSRSIPDDLREAAQNYVRRVARRASGEDRLGIIGFDGQADVDLITSRGGLDVVSFGMASQPDRTDIAAGLRMAMATFPEGFARRIVLLSDGNENVGNVLAEADTAAASGIAIDVVPLTYQHRADILVDRIVLPAHSSRDTRIPLRLIVKSLRPTRARLSLFHNDREVPLGDPIVELEGRMRPNRLTIPVRLQTAGAHRFEARITPISPEDDEIPANNVATAFTFVGEKGRVLILTQPGVTDDVVLYEALKREKIDVEMFGVDQLPIDLLTLQQYAAVILANVSADMFTATQQKALASYVRDFGGGLILIGGNEGFGAGGWIGTPIEDISPVAFEIKHRKIIPRGALVIIMHSCELPKGNYWGEQVAMTTVDTISSLDYLGVVCYSYRVNGPNWEVPLAPLRNKQAVKRAIKQMQIGDMPDFDTTMRMAVKALMDRRDAAQRHIIIISDGDPSPPSRAILQTMVDNDITCSTVGIGYGVHVVEKTLRDIATKTHGRFYAVKDPRRLPQIFVKEAKVIRRGLIDEHAFQPILVDSFAQTVEGLAAVELPPLDGLVLTQPKPDCLVPIVRRGEEGDDPVFAQWNIEMGKVVAFTSGWWPRWGRQWAAWERFGKFWAQVVRWVARQEASADFDVVTRVEGQTGHVLVEALDKEAGYLNFLHFTGRVLTPELEMERLALFQTGPGRYEGTFEVRDHGNYLVSLQYTTPNGPSGVVRTGLSVSYSPEFRDLQANLGLLQQVAERTGGRWFEPMNAAADPVFSHDLPPVVSRRPVWRDVIAWLLLPLFILDVASRRLASVVAMSLYVEIAVLVMAVGALHAAGAGWWGYLGALVLAEIVGWTIRYRSILPTIRFFTYGVRVMARVGQRSAGSLSQLKGVRRAVRDRMEAEADHAPAQAEPSEPAPDRTRRFDVGDQATVPTGDVTETLGEAAVSEGTPAEHVRKAKPKTEREEGRDDMTSRLREAKKRAKDRLNRQRDEE